MKDVIMHRSVGRPFGRWIAIAAFGVACGCHNAAPSRGAGSADDTYAAARSSNDSVARSRLARFEDMLRNVPGVLVSSSAGGFSVRVRGASSFVGTGEPLYVLDDVIMQGHPMDALQNIRPSDVARIEVLRDAGATTYYGSRGANGVILITMKKTPDR
jgi:TonB-dependent SusC/RagA subfamily outer membrane receptor